MEGEGAVLSDVTEDMGQIGSENTGNVAESVASDFDGISNDLGKDVLGDIAKNDSEEFNEISNDLENDLKGNDPELADDIEELQEKDGGDGNEDGDGGGDDEDGNKDGDDGDDGDGDDNNEDEKEKENKSLWKRIASFCSKHGALCLGSIALVGLGIDIGVKEAEINKERKHCIKMCVAPKNGGKINCVKGIKPKYKSSIKNNKSIPKYPGASKKTCSQFNPTKKKTINKLEQANMASYCMHKCDKKYPKNGCTLVSGGKVACKAADHVFHGAENIIHGIWEWIKKHIIYGVLILLGIGLALFIIKRLISGRRNKQMARIVSTGYS